jgi:hypothetical protein
MPNQRLPTFTYGQTENLLLVVVKMAGYVLGGQHRYGSQTDMCAWTKLHKMDQTG